MDFNEFESMVKEMFESWANDKTLQEYYNEEDLKAEFLETIQAMIGGNFLIMTEKFLKDTCEGYHASMEGYFYDD